MKRFLLSASVLLGALAPAATFAAPFTDASEILAALAASTGAYDASYEMHGQVGTGTWVAAWVKSTGGISADRELSSQGKITVDVATSQATMRVKGQASMTDGQAYVFVDEISGKMESTVATLSALFKTKQWISLPMEALGGMKLSPQETLALLADPIVAQTLNQAMTVESIGTDSYLLKLNPAALAELHPGEPVPQELFFAIRAHFGADGRLLNADITGSMTMEGMSGTLTGTIVRHQGAFSVKAPASSVSVEEIFAGFESMFSGFAPFQDPFAGPTDPWMGEDEWTDDGSSEDVEWTEEPPVCDVSMMRKGLCNTERIRTRN